MDKTLLFLHIPKTAGTTLRNIIYRQYNPNNVFTIDFHNWPFKAIQELDSMPALQKDKLELMMGHMEYGWHKHVTSDVTYLTMLRDPVDRIISHYYYEKIEGRPYYDLAHKYSLADYLKYSNVTEIDNGLVRFISGNLNAPFGECTSSMLEEAKVNIQKPNFLLGLSEYFDESILHYREELRWNKSMFYIKRNANKLRENNIDDRTKAVITETNQYDIAFYDFAKTLFLETINSDRKLIKKVKTFKKINYLLGLGYPIYRAYKSLRNQQSQI